MTMGDVSGAALDPHQLTAPSLPEAGSSRSTGTLNSFSINLQDPGLRYAVHFRSITSDGGRTLDEDVKVTTFTVDISSL